MEKDLDLNANIVDTHAHLDMVEFDADRDEVIRRARESGVNTIISIGIDVKSSLRAIELAGSYAGILATVGIHPQESEGITLTDIKALEDMAANSRVVAIGEMGLDFFRNPAPREIQFKVLQWELELARRVRLPVVIHCRQAQKEMLEILKDWVTSFPLPPEKSRGVIHCFSGDLDTAESYLDLGFYLAVGAYIGYPSSAAFREVVCSLPIEKLVIETDCPFLPPQKLRGKRNEPSYTLVTLGAIAEIKQISLEEAIQQTTKNAIRLFNLTEARPECGIT